MNPGCFRAAQWLTDGDERKVKVTDGNGKTVLMDSVKLSQFIDEQTGASALLDALHTVKKLAFDPSIARATLAKKLKRIFDQIYYAEEGAYGPERSAARSDSRRRSRRKKVASKTKGK